MSDVNDSHVSKKAKPKVTDAPEEAPQIEVAPNEFSITRAAHTQPMKAHAPMSEPKNMRGLGDTVDTFYEWWNADLMTKACTQLLEELAAAQAHVEREAVPRVDEQGRKRTRPTESEKLVQKKGERLERLRLLASKMGEPIEASEVRIDAKGAVTKDGARCFHFPGKMRSVKVRYARMRKVGSERGRRYPKNVPCLLREGDDWVGEADRLLAVTAQGMPRDVRAFCLPYLRDIDLRAAHASICASKGASFNVATPKLIWYVANIDDCRQMVMAIHNVTYDDAKTLFTSLLYGGSYEHRLEEWGCKGDLQARPILFVQELERELKKLRDAAMSHHELKQLVDPLLKDELTRKSNFSGELKTMEEAKRSVWSQVAQMWEDQALGCIQEVVEEHGLVIHSLMFDGLMVYHDPNIDLAATLTAASERIREKTGMHLKLEEKKLFDEARVDQLV